jgi:hypothetical protein
MPGSVLGDPVRPASQNPAAASRASAALRAFHLHIGDRVARPQASSLCSLPPLAGRGFRSWPGSARQRHLHSPPAGACYVGVHTRAEDALAAWPSHHTHGLPNRCRALAQIHRSSEAAQSAAPVTQTGCIAGLMKR